MQWEPPRALDSSADGNRINVFSRVSGSKILFSRIIEDKQTRNMKIIEAVMRYGFSQKEVAEYLKMHYSTISRLIKEEEMSKFKT